MTDWQVFQSDVLDVLRQYRGYFDFFERVGSLSDSSRPDCIARITRKGKKEVWIIDAKSKSSISDGDIERIENYVEKIKSNPVDVGLEYSEIKQHCFREILVSPEGLDTSKESIAFEELHQFLQRELIYTDQERVVRDIAKMMKRGKLDHQQARLLYRSLEPYQIGLNQLRTVLNGLERSYAGVEINLSGSEKYDLPVDAVLRHSPRSKVFLLDVPYSEKALESVESKKKVITEQVDSNEEEVFYAAVNRFGSEKVEAACRPDCLEDRFRRKAGVIPANAVADIFKPKIPLEESGKAGRKVFRGSETGFMLAVETKNDFEHVIEAKLPEDAANQLNQKLLNVRRDFGTLEKRRFRMEIEISGDMEVSYGGNSEDIDSFRESVETLFCSSVSPVLARMNNKY